MNETSPLPPATSWIDRLIRFCLLNKILVFLGVLLLAGWGFLVSPFFWNLGSAYRDPVPVDAIPDIGENQQIVFTEWSGRSPQDVEDQITYPLTVSLLGIPDIKTIRSQSMFGFSSIYVIFKDGADFYWSRSRILEKLNSLPESSLPEGVKPSLGPDATAMGQVFWYTLEGRDAEGNPCGGWDLQELRSIQDWHVRYSLLSVEGVSEVASIGGFVQEYQVDLDPDLMRINNVTLDEVLAAVRGSNRDVGAKTIEVNRVEYLVRGIGFIKKPEDIENAVIRLREGVPIFVKNVARVSLGPAWRQGALDKGGVEAVGGAVVVRYGGNPLQTIHRVKEKIEEIAPGLPRKTLPDGTVSQVRIIPFYDRTQLIRETIGTLREALTEEILVTILVVVLMVMHLPSALLASALLPLAVLMSFIAMKMFRVDANVVALSGIAIAIGTMVDMGIILTENILRHLDQSLPGENRLAAVYRASCEVGGAVLTAVSTTIVSFLPVFALEGAEGKLFKPLAFTKTFALFSSLIVALIVIPPAAHLLFRKGTSRKGWILSEGMIYLAGVLSYLGHWKIGLVLGAMGGYRLILIRLSDPWKKRLTPVTMGLIAAGIALALCIHWLPLGPEKGFVRNLVFVGGSIGIVLSGYALFRAFYRPILGWCLAHKASFLAIPLTILLLGLSVWLGYRSVFFWMPGAWMESGFSAAAARLFPGLGREFMPSLDEGSYLFMPSVMPHASIGEVLDILKKQDMAIQAIPEVETVVGKLGRADSPLDPAPVSMIETVVTYRPEYLRDDDGNLLRFRHSSETVDLFRDLAGNPLKAPDGQPYLVKGRFARDRENRLIPDPLGAPFRLWRPRVDPALNPGRKPWPGIVRPDDVWRALVAAARVPGTTSPAKLQPISARMVMLQSGIRASIGIKVMGPDQHTIQKVALDIETCLREVSCIDPTTVVADRIIAKPYLEIRIDRQAMAGYGINLDQVLNVIDFAIGGKRITTTVEGRERYPVRVRYARELRDDLESIGNVLVPASDGTQIPLGQMADIYYVRGPGEIKGENTFLVGYILFEKVSGHAEVEVVEQARNYLKQKIDRGELMVPAGVSYTFIGTYENQVRSEKRLMLILPVCLISIFIILYLQFRSVSTSMLVFAGIPVCWAGGFILIWLYGQPWFLNFHVFGISMRELFQVAPINLSVAVWVGFLALFGIAEDDGVVMTTYLEGAFSSRKISSVQEIRQTVIEGCLRRLRPCLMTTATTMLALLPVLTATGKGSDIMVPMAIPAFGGMAVELITMLVVPVIYCAVQERRWSRRTEGRSF